MILVCILTLTFIHSHAQIEKGTYQVGIGGLPIIYPNVEEPLGYSLRVNYGFFLVDNLSIGILPFSGRVGDISSFGANCYLRYYLMNSKFSLFLEGGGGLGRLEYDYSPRYNGTLLSINIGPGLHYLPKNKLAFEFLFQYARLSNIEFPDNTSIGHTIIPSLGIQYFIRR